MKKILTIVGARPQFVKAAAVSRAFQEKSNLEEVIVHTGQHYDKNMSDVFFEEMYIPKPHYHLNINSLSHGAMTGRMLEEIEKVIQKESPTHVLVYGDTNSTLAGALAAKKLHIKLIHVEAGLRSFNMKMPEEINRVLTDRISDILFCPTDLAVKNLKQEGFDQLDIAIIKNGDVMEDAALFYSEMAKHKSNILQKLDLTESEYYLVTCHRAENTDNPANLKVIVDVLNELNKTKRVILPLHPRTQNALSKNNLKFDFETISPVGYFDMIQLIKNSDLVLTDSGGLQKEAFFFDKFCVTLRDQTEWMELIDGRYNYLTGADFSKIIKAVNEAENRSFQKNDNYYGGGKAALKIAEVISNEG